MKTQLILGGGFALLLGVVVWQRQSLATLQSEEARVVATGKTVQAQAVAKREEVAAPEAPVQPVSDEQMEAAVASFRRLAKEAGTGGSGDGRVLQQLTLEKYGDLIDLIEQMSPEELARLYEQARDEQGGDKDKRGISGSGPRVQLPAAVYLLEMVNPAGMLQVYLGEPDLRLAATRGFYIFPKWFRHDAAGLLQWAESWPKGAVAGQETTPAQSDFARQAELWAVAAKILKNPGDAAVAELAREMGRNEQLPEEDQMVSLGVKKAGPDDAFKQKRWLFAGPIGALGVSLETSNARLEFLRSLHAATGGNAYFASFVNTMTARVPFEQAAQLADLAPEFNADGKSTLGTSLRLNVARESLDGTPAERWNWLTQREAVKVDTVKVLVRDWGRADWEGTKAWIQTLPTGELREAAEGEFQRQQR